MVYIANRHKKSNHRGKKESCVRTMMQQLFTKLNAHNQLLNSEQKHTKEEIFEI